MLAARKQRNKAHGVLKGHKCYREYREGKEEILLACKGVYSFRWHGRENFIEKKYLSKGLKKVWKKTMWTSRGRKTKNIINPAIY